MCILFGKALFQKNECLLLALCDCPPSNSKSQGRINFQLIFLSFFSSFLSASRHKLFIITTICSSQFLSDFYSSLFLFPTLPVDSQTRRKRLVAINEVICSISYTNFHRSHYFYKFFYAVPDVESNRSSPMYIVEHGSISASAHRRKFITADLFVRYVLDAEAPYCATECAKVHPVSTQAG